MNFQDFFKEGYITVGKHEVLHHNIHVKHGIVNVWANRISGCEYWIVTLELHECISEQSDTWQTNTKALGYMSDKELLKFVENFDKDNYFPLYQECEADQCAYNCDGICKYEQCFGKKPVFDEDDDNGCSGYCHNFA